MITVAWALFSQPLPLLLAFLTLVLAAANVRRRG